MKSIKLTEATFEHSEIVDFQKNKKLMLLINLLAVVLFVVFYFLFFYIYALLFGTPLDNPLYFYRTLKSSSHSYTLVFILLILLNTVLHELIHGLFFWLFTGEKPVFGFKSVYAYAGAPNWYIPKVFYQMVSLSPLVLIAIIGYFLMWILPEKYSFLIFITFTANAAGSVGDLWVSAKLLKMPAETFVHDTGVVSGIYY